MPTERVDDEYSIDELARRAGTNVRNVRFYQARGLLPPARKVGRTMRYGPDHVERVEQVRDLIARGYSVAAIQELFDASQAAGGLDHILLKAAVHRPSTAQPRVLRPSELSELLGGLQPADLERVVKVGLVERQGRKFHVPNPLLLDVAVRLLGDGVPLRRVLTLVDTMQKAAERAATAFVEVFVDEIWAPLERDGATPQQLKIVVKQIETYRRLSPYLIGSLFAEAGQRAIEKASVGRGLPPA